MKSNHHILNHQLQILSRAVSVCEAKRKELTEIVDRVVTFQHKIPDDGAIANLSRTLGISPRSIRHEFLACLGKAQ